jgi:hypothetical protein
MINFKSFKWGYGIAVSLVFGLSSCYMDGRNPQNVDYSAHQTMKATTDTKAKTKVASKSSSKEPIQKSTPGPKQVAAPQLPVIQ